MTRALASVDEFAGEGERGIAKSALLGVGLGSQEIANPTPELLQKKFKGVHECL